MTKELRALEAGDQGLIPRTRRVAHNHTQVWFQGIQGPLLIPSRHTWRQNPIKQFFFPKNETEEGSFAFAGLSSPAMASPSTLSRPRFMH